MNKNEIILVTGSAGFIGFHVSRRLLEEGYNVVGLDSLNEYYDIRLKLDRNSILKEYDNYSFYHVNLCDFENIEKIFMNHDIKKVCHLAAQAGVRYSISHPLEYQKSNLQGFQNIIEISKNFNVDNFVYASSSSVYGGNEKLPFSENDPVNNPISLYAATKRSNELVAHTYSHLFKMNTTGLRFFTVYGPWGRPDMALFLFTRAIIENKSIDVYNNGNMRRSFSYIDDIVEGIIAVLEKSFPYEIFNLGNDTSSSLLEYIEIIEKSLSKKAIKNMMPIQLGDVPQTIADLTHANKMLNFQPKTHIEEGIQKFVKWFREYYKI